MSWASIIKKNTNNINKQLKKDKPKIIIKPNVNVIYKDTPETLFDMYKGGDLLDGIIDIKDDCNKYTPNLLSKAKPYNIQEFLYKYINMEDSIPNHIRKYLYDDEESDSDESVQQYNN